MNNMRNKILSLLVLLLTAATGAQAGIKVGDVFMFGTNVNFGSSRVYCKFKSGSNDTDKTGMSGNPLMTYGGYDGVKHKLVFTFTSATSYLYIVSDNPVQPYGIKVSGGDGTKGNLFTFSAVYDLADGHTADLNIGSDDACTFAMPASNATATYELVRDMAVSVNAYVGTDPNTDYRHRVKKVNNQFVPDGITDDAQIIALFPVIDVIDAQNPKRLNYGTDFTVTIIDGNQNEYAIDQFSFAPGTYSVKVTGIGDYDGQIESLNDFDLYYGYEVPVPSKEYVTYRSETEKLAIDTESGAKMYTVRGASSSAVTVSEETSVDAGLGILLYNPTDNDVTALLIPTETAMANAPQSDGTWSTVIGSVTASDDWDNYIRNGYQFVITRGSGMLPANRWALALKKNQQQNARALTIAFDDATGISTTNFTNYTNEAWYDLNGRKLNGKPNRKGVYIMNGKKVLK